MISVRYTIRSLGQRLGSTMGAALGIALVAFVVAASVMLVNGIERSLKSTGDDDVVLVFRQGAQNELGSSIPRAVAQRVEGMPYIKRRGEEPIVSFENLAVINVDIRGTTHPANLILRGVDEGAFTLRDNLQIVEGRKPNPGTDEAIIGKRLAGRFSGVELGGKIPLGGANAVRIVGVFENDGSAFESEVWVGGDYLRRAMGLDNAYQTLRMRLNDASAIDSMRADFKADKSLPLSVEAEPAYYARQGEDLAGLITALGGITAVLMAAAAGLGATITIHGSVASRRREIGTLRALGFSRARILGAILFESLMLTVVAGAIGSGAAMALQTLKLSLANAQTFSQMVFTFEATPQVWLIGFSTAVAMGVIGGFFPALRASQVSPAAGMRQ